MILRRQLISRSEAIAAGLTRYFTGKPCPKGHVAERMTCNKVCYQCLYGSIEARKKTREYKNKHQVRLRNTRNKWTKRNIEKVKAKNKRWRTNNPEKIAVYDRQHRARKRNAFGFHTVADIHALLIKQNHACCGLNCSFDLRRGYHVDHKIPLIRGGSNWPRNLQLLCPPCNLNKGTKTNGEWRRMRVTSSTVETA